MTLADTSVRTQPLAHTPCPLYTAVIFTSLHTQWTHQHPQEYLEAAQLMDELVQDQPGFLGYESARDLFGFGITVSYWRNEADAQAWKMNATHRGIQLLGQDQFYTAYCVRIATVMHEYGFDNEQCPPRWRRTGGFLES